MTESNFIDNKSLIGKVICAFTLVTATLFFVNVAHHQMEVHKTAHAHIQAH